jgi:MFS family permease
MTGGATGAAIIALQRHVGRAAQDVTEMKQVFSWLSVGPAISNFIGPFTAGVLIDYSGFQCAYAAMAVLPILAWFWVRTTQELPAVVNPPGHEANSAWDLLNDSMSACWDVHTFVVPILGHERNLSASSIGSILGAFAIAAALIRFLLPMVVAKLQEWQVITSAMPITSALLAIYPFAQGALTMGICSVFLGLSLGSVQPMVMSTLHQITPESRHGEALGLRLMGINASSVLMPMVFGAAGAVIGVGAVFWCVSLAVGLGSRSAYLLRVHKKHE